MKIKYITFFSTFLIMSLYTQDADLKNNWAVCNTIFSNDRINDITYCNDGLLAGSCSDGVTIWDTNNNNQVKKNVEVQFSGNGLPMAYDRQNGNIITGFNDDYLVSIPANTDQATPVKVFPKKHERQLSRIDKLKHSRYGNIILAFGYIAWNDYSAILWKKTNKEHNLLVKSRVYDAEFDSGGTYIALAYRNIRGQMVDIESDSIVAQMPESDYSVKSISSISPYVFALGCPGEVRLWDTRTKKVEGIFKLSGYDEINVLASPNGNDIAASSKGLLYDRTLKIYSLNAKEVHTEYQSNSPIQAITFDGSGNNLAVATYKAEKNSSQNESDGKMDTAQNAHQQTYLNPCIEILQKR